LLLQATKDDLTRKENILSRYCDSGKVLGEGSFGQVSVYVNIRSMKSYAVKIVKKSKECPEEDLEALNEFFILRSLKHPYVIRVKEIYETDSSFKIVMDFLEGTHLAKFLFTRPRMEATTKDIMQKIF
jgi:serine/threonine protein kinase